MGTKTKPLAWIAGTLALCVAVDLAGRANEMEQPIVAASWPAGLEVRYGFAWTVASAVASTTDGATFPLSANVDLVGSLRLTSHGEQDGATVLEASLEDITQHHVEVLGKTVFADEAAARAQLVGPKAWIALAKNGRVERVYFAPKAPPVFKHLMQTMLAMTQVSSGEGAHYTAVEPGPSGIARATYRRDGRSLARVRDRYERITVVPDAPNARPDLEAAAKITLDGGNRIASLVDDEHLVVLVPGSSTPLYQGTSHFVLTAESNARVTVTSVPALSQMQARAPGELVFDGDVQRGHLEQRAAGITLDQIERGMRRSWGTARDEKRAWFSQAVAAIQLDASLVDDVIEFGFGEGTSRHTRLVAFDLLASAGTPEAQAAMRGALGTEDFVDLVQRFTRVAQPTADTARFVRDAHTTAKTTDAQIATSFTVGAVAKALRATEPKLAAELDGVLRDGLANARTSEAREHAIIAIGNASLPDELAVVGPHARDAAPEVRSSVAMALRNNTSAAARDVLLELASDSDVRVVRAAFGAMRKQPLAVVDLERLERVQTKHPAADAALVDLLSRQLHQDSPAVRRMLEAIAQRAAANPDLQERTRVLLAQLD